MLGDSEEMLTLQFSVSVGAAHMSPCWKYSYIHLSHNVTVKARKLNTRKEVGKICELNSAALIQYIYHSFYLVLTHGVTCFTVG